MVPGFVFDDYDTYASNLAGQLTTALGTTVTKDDVSVITGSPQGLPVFDAKNAAVGVTFFVPLRPSFWTWLAGQNKLDLSSSLVYVGACLTDSTSNLRNAVGSSA